MVTKRQLLYRDEKVSLIGANEQWAIETGGQISDGKFGLSRSLQYGKTKKKFYM